MTAWLSNPRVLRSAPDDGELAIISLAAAQRARAVLSTWPEFAPTPLRSLDVLAGSSGVAAIHYKDESQRLGLGSFKALGGAYAADLAIRDWFSGHPGNPPAKLTVTCATDGNHGRSVAFGARRHGCRCVVYMHERAPQDKAAAIEALDAKVVWTHGTYDDSVRIARAAAAQANWLLIPDTSNDPDDPLPRRVMQGYGVITLELLEQLPVVPTHVFVQAGVGGLAAAMAATLAEAYGHSRPRLVVVEPERAACVFASAANGQPTAVTGSLETAMAMLSCGEVSPIAWRILDRRADAFVTIDDAAAVEWTRRLRAGDERAAALDVGVSGAAGLAGLQCVLADATAKRELQLDAESHVVVIGTEASVPSS